MGSTLVSGLDSAQGYRAELHTFAGRHSERYFGSSDDAHTWIMARYAELPQAESAAAIVDNLEGRRRIFAIDPNLVPPVS